MLTYDLNGSNGFGKAGKTFWQLKWHSKGVLIEFSKAMYMGDLWYQYRPASQPKTLLVAAKKA